MYRWLPLFLMVLAVAVLFVWKLWAPHTAPLAAPVAAAPADDPTGQQPDVLYSWVDKNGVTHFAQRAGRNATRLEYDGSRITPLEPVQEPFRLGAGAASAPAPEAAPESVAGVAEHTSPASSHREQRGSDLLHKMRREMKETQQRMQEHKQQQGGDL